jgi:tetratricopeptide (TPR) repeat protein
MPDMEVGMKTATLILALAAAALSWGQAAGSGDDLQAEYANLKAAQEKKDADAVIASARRIAELSRKISSAAKPEGMSDEDWKHKQEYATQVQQYAEYALCEMALQPPGPKTLTVVDALVEINPKSQYLSRTYPNYLVALNQTAPDKLVPSVEKLAANDPNNEDLLLVLSDAYLSRKNNQKALEYSTKLIDVLKSKPKPEGISDADWDKKKEAALGRAYWTAGIVHATENKFSEADQQLRAALPLIKGNDQMMAGALFYLGVANYRLGQKSKNRTHIQDALRFSQQAAAIKSPFQAPAQQNVKAIRTEFHIQ